MLLSQLRIFSLLLLSLIIVIKKPYFHFLPMINYKLIQSFQILLIHPAYPSNPQNSARSWKEDLFLKTRLCLQFL